MYHLNGAARRLESALRIRPLTQPVKKVARHSARTSEASTLVRANQRRRWHWIMFCLGRSRSTRRPPIRRLRPRLTPSPPVPFPSSLTWADTIRARHPSSTSSQSRSLLERRERLRGGGEERVRYKPLSALSCLKNRSELREGEISVIAPKLIGTTYYFVTHVPCPGSSCWQLFITNHAFTYTCSRVHPKDTSAEVHWKSVIVISDILTNRLYWQFNDNMDFLALKIIGYSEKNLRLWQFG